MVDLLPVVSLSSQLTDTGGDGLVAARHLWHYGYQPTIFYPKQSKNDLYERLATQLKNLDVPFTEDFNGSLETTDHVVDAIFGITIKSCNTCLEAHISQGSASQARCETRLRIRSLLWRPPKSLCYLSMHHRHGVSKMVRQRQALVQNSTQQL